MRTVERRGAAAIAAAALIVAACAAPKDATSGARAPTLGDAAQAGYGTGAGAGGGGAAPSRREGAAPAALAPGTRGTSEPPAPASGATTPATLPPDSVERRQLALRHARDEVVAAERQLELAASDCGAACRALGSLERATGHLCDLAEQPDERRGCEDARARVVHARERIRGACGATACGADGPSLDPAAPIPSRR